MGTFIIIYLIGYILAYYYTRWAIRTELEELYNWTDVKFTALISIISWVLVVAAIVTHVRKAFKNEKPPIWL